MTYKVVPMEHQPSDDTFFFRLADDDTDAESNPKIMMLKLKAQYS